jgi:hypothetical protein
MGSGGFFLTYFAAGIFGCVEFVCFVLVVTIDHCVPEIFLEGILRWWDCLRSVLVELFSEQWRWVDTWGLFSTDWHSQKGYMGRLIRALEISVQARSKGEYLSTSKITNLTSCAISLCFWSLNYSSESESGLFLVSTSTLNDCHSLNWEPKSCWQLRFVPQDSYEIFFTPSNVSL